MHSGPDAGEGICGTCTKRETCIFYKNSTRAVFNCEEYEGILEPSERVNSDSDNAGSDSVSL